MAIHPTAQKLINLSRSVGSKLADGGLHARIDALKLISDLASIAETTAAAVPSCTTEAFELRDAFLPAIHSGELESLIKAHRVFEAAVFRAFAATAAKGSADTKTDLPNKRATVNARMYDEYTGNPESLEWSAQDWATRLGCSKSAVLDTKVWDAMKLPKAEKKIAKASPKGSQRRRKHRPK